MASASDSFTRSNESPLSGDWESINSAGLALVSNAVTGTNNGANNVSAWKSSSTSFSADQTSQIVFTVNSNFDNAGPAVRCSSGGNAYYARVNREASEILIKKLTSGSESDVGTSYSGSVANSDSVRLEASGSGTVTLDLYINDSLVKSVTDSSSPHESGQPGLFYYWGDSGATILDDFSASDSATAGVTITDAGDESFLESEASVTITGTGFGSTQGNGVVKISPTDDVDDASAVSQTVNSWSDTSVEIAIVRGALPVFTNLYLFVTENGGSSNAAGHVVQLETAPIVLTVA